MVDRVLHGVVTALTFSVGLLTFCHYHRRWMASFLSALMFAVHPIHVEAVANSTGEYSMI